MALSIRSADPFTQHAECFIHKVGEGLRTIALSPYQYRGGDCGQTGGDDDTSAQIASICS